MSHILLISCNLATSPYPVFPLGLAQVAGALVTAGHDVRQIDMQVANLDITTILANNADFSTDIIALSVRNIDDVDSHQSFEEGWYLEQTRRIIAEIKSVTSTPIILGGAGFSLMAESILEFTGAHFGIVGEGEVAMCELVAKLEEKQYNPANIPQLHSAPKLSGATIPAPLFDQHISRHYASACNIMGIQSKRGCPHQCAYCSYPIIEGSAMRFRAPESVAEQMEYAHKEFGTKHFVFCDSVFNDHKKHFLQVAEAIKRKALPVQWSGYFRPSDTTLEELEFLKSAGLSALEIGTDSASDATLAAMNKPFSFDEVIEFNALCTKLELAAAHFIIMGGPQETYATAQEGLKNIKALTRSVVFVYQGVRILPQTIIESIALAEGVITKETSLLQPTYYHSAHIDQKVLSNMLEADFSNDISRMFPPSKANQMDKALRKMGHTGLLWDKLLIPTGTRQARRRKRKEQAQGDMCTNE